MTIAESFARFIYVTKQEELLKTFGMGIVLGQQGKLPL